MARKFSAYLSIYNDWDILPCALRSVASHVDELIVVDGAYDWMVPYLHMLGVDPTRSDSRVYDAIEASGIPFRVISRTWPNEVEKRQFGYDACTHDFIYRVDADEVLFLDEKELETALSLGLAVGEMEMPNYVAPGWISRAKDLSRIERQGLLFDRRQVNAGIHLNYLWLILTADKLPLAGTKPFAVYPKSLAFNAHLTGWRTPRTAVNRAAFYILNWMRQNGVPWLPPLRDRPLTNVQAFFDLVAPNDFLSSLSRGRIACGMIESATTRSFVPSPLDDRQERDIVIPYRTFIRSLAEMNRIATVEEQPFLTTLPTLLDLSSPDARRAIAPNGIVSLRISAPLHAGKAQLLTYSKEESGNEFRELPVRLHGTDMHVELPAGLPDDSHIMRQCMEFHVWPDSLDLSQRFHVIT